MADKQQPTDAGKTSGGGGLGHEQPDEVKREAPLRNNPGTRGNATGSEDDPVMPADDATLKTKI